MKNKREKWERLTNEIVTSWIYKYFELSDEEEIGFDWVQIGDVFNFADYWFSFGTVLDCYELNVTKEQLFLWYDKSVSQEIDLPLRDFIISPKKLKEQKEKHLAELKLRVETAKEDLEKAICAYNER